MPHSVKSLAADLGFDECRIARAAPAAHADTFRQWLADGCHGDMAWLQRSPERRCDPREVLPGCKAVICLALNYYTGSSPFPPRAAGGYRIARYAWNDDYHLTCEVARRDYPPSMLPKGRLSWRSGTKNAVAK